MDLFKVSDLSVHVDTDDGRITLLDHASLEIGSDSWIALIGPSGCGKSSLLNAMLGFLPKDGVCTSGSVSFDDITAVPARIGPGLIGNDPLQAVRGSRMGCVMQNLDKALNETRKIGKQVEEVFPDVRNKKEKALELLTAVGVNDPKRVYRSYPMQVSPGTIQKIMTGMAVVREPELLLLDEPFSALDQLSREDMIRLYGDLRKRKKTSALLVTHSYEEAKELCELCCFMRNGRLSSLYPTAEVTMQDMLDLTEI